MKCSIIMMYSIIMNKTKTMNKKSGDPDVWSVVWCVFLVATHHLGEYLWFHQKLVKEGSAAGVDIYQNVDSG